MNCPRCHSKCQVTNYPSIDRQTYYCCCGGTTELFRCNVYHDCDLITFRIESFVIFELPLFISYYDRTASYYDRTTLPSSLGATYWAIAYQTNVSQVLRREEQRISFKEAYRQLQRYRKLLVFS